MNDTALTLIPAVAETATQLCAVDQARIEWGAEGFRFGVVWCCPACAARPESLVVLAAADKRERRVSALVRPGSSSGAQAGAYLDGDERALGMGPDTY